MISLYVVKLHERPKLTWFTHRPTQAEEITYVSKGARQEWSSYRIPEINSKTFLIGKPFNMSTGHSQYSVQSNSWLTSSGNHIFNRLAGTPPTTSYGATFRTTTALAPTTAPVPTFTPGNITAPSQIHTSFPITVGVTTLGSPLPSNLEISASEYCLARDPCNPRAY